MPTTTEQNQESTGSRNGQDQNGHSANSSESVFHFSDNPGRRNGERWNVTMPNESVVKRLYGRFSQAEPPEPGNLRDTYKKSLILIESYRPLRAARLDDLIGRVEYAFARYKAIKKEEETHFQNANEEARNANEWIDNRVGLLRSEKDTSSEKWNSDVETRRQELADANEEAAVAHTASGNPMPYRYRGQEEDLGGQTISVPSNPPSISEMIGQVASVGQSVAQTANVQAVESARSIKGILSRLRGGLQFRVGARGDAEKNPLSTDIISASDAPQPKLPLGPYPNVVPFPLEECLSQATPLDAIAVQQGLPSVSPMAEALDSKQQIISWFALLACGSIFGASIGLLTRIVWLADFSINSQAAEWKFVALCILGIFMFWILGRVAFAGAAMASEERHQHLLACHRDDPLKVGKWLQWASRWSLGLLVLVGIVLVAIEAVVERYGIVSTFADGMQNANIASGLHNASTSGINPVALVFMVLTVSLPFVLLHMAHGWADARHKVIRQYLVGRQKQQAWEIASKCHTERTHLVVAQYNKDRVSEDDAHQKAIEAEAQSAREEKLAAVQADADVHTGVTGANLEAGIHLDPAQSEANEPNEGDKVIPIRKEEVARALAKAWEAEQSWRRLRKERKDAITWYDDRIAAYEAEREKESPQPEQSTKQRVDSAHGVYTGALKHFEETYQREVRQLENLMKAGFMVRLWLALFRPQLTGKEIADRRF